MSEQIDAPQVVEKNHGWQVTFAGMGINLALGILYTWSVIAGGIPEEWGWDQADKSWPYSVACLVFCLIMVPAGRMQDKLSPKLVASIGGVLVGVGFIVASMTTSLVGFIIGFGVLAGAGIGFGYASATPPAVKWFPAAKTGMIAGIVVSGFGLASIYAAPLAQWLMTAYSFKVMLMVLGIAFLVVVVGLAQLVRPPKPGYVPAGQAPVAAPVAGAKKEDFLPKEMLKTTQFWMLWFMYACGAGAGLMVISVAKKIVAGQLETLTTEVAAKWAIASVVGLAIGNGGGRIIAGIISDKIGRKATMFIFFVFQAILLVLLSQAPNVEVLRLPLSLILITALIGANYGSNLALFPSITKDFFGVQNFGMNYGLVFTAWGIGGFMLAKLAGKIYVQTQSFNFAYFCAAGLLILAAIMVFALKPPQHVHED